MKNKITTEVKQRIFGLYIGAEVIAPHPNEEGEFLPGYLTGIHGEMEAEVQHLENGNVYEHPEYHDFDNTSLVLKSLLSISDEDAIELTKVYRIYAFDGDKERIIVGKELAEAYRGNRTLRMSQYSFIVDYLRSKSYALPTCGYSVDELIKAGVFKIKEEKDVLKKPEKPDTSESNYW